MKWKIICNKHQTYFGCHLLVFILSLQFFFWWTNDLLNLALLLPICNNYGHVKVGTCETLKIHQSFFCIKNFQKIKLKKMSLTWVEKLILWRTPKLLGGLTANPKVKTTEGEGVEARSLTHNTLGVELWDKDLED